MERLVIAEPMTVFTNFLLAAFAGWIAWRLRQPNGPRMISRRLWALGIALQGLGAFAGGIYHGFAPIMSSELAAGGWLVTRLALGLATMCLVSGMGFVVLAAETAKGLWIVMAVKFLVYAVWCVRQPEFLPALVDQILSAVLLIALLLYGREQMGRACDLIAGGLAAIFVGGLIQFLQLAPHPQFNHNDLYHAFALISLACFYLGGRQLTDHASGRSLSQEE